MEFRSAALILARAEERAIEEENYSTTTTLEISVQHHVPYGQMVCISGSVRELGDWDPKSAPALTWSEGEVWIGEVDVKRHQLGKLEYKFVVLIPEDPQRFEWETGSNHNILALPCRRISIRDRWGFPGYNHNIP